MNRRFDVFVAFAALAVGFATHVCASVPTGYVTDGLVACWDAIDNVGTGIHDGAATTWVDLVGGQAFQLTGTSWGEKYLQFAGKATSYGRMTGGDALALFDNEKGVSERRTVELVFKYDSATTDGVILQTHTHANIAIGRYEAGQRVIYCCQSSSTELSRPADEFYTISAHYYLGWIQTGSTYQDNQLVPLTRGPNNWSGANDTQVTIGMKTSAATCFAGRLYAIRVYDRKLSSEEATQNYNADQLRYNSEPAATVLAGSVTISGDTFAAGETILTPGSSSTLELDAATDATLVLEPRIKGLLHASGTLKLAEAASYRMTYLDSLTLGAGTVLQLPAGGLDVTGELSADAGATVKGPGVLVGAEADCPAELTFTDGAVYRCATGDWTGWPSSGIAYVPVGATAAIATADDVVNVANLDGIVFLNDGSDAAKASCVTYTAAEPLRLKAVVSGLGSFIATDAALLTILGDNSALVAPGHFAFTNSPVIVSNRCGLGSSATGAAWLMFGARSSIDFGCDTPAFTNDVAIKYERSGSNLVTIGPRNAGEEFCQNADFIHQTGGTVYIRNTVKFIGGLVKNVDGYAAGPGATRYLYFNAASGHDAANPAHLWFKDGVTFSFHYCLFLYNGAKYGLNVHFGKTAKPYNSAGFCAYHYVFEDDDVFTAGGTPWPYGGKLDLNGHDQSMSQISLTYCGNTPTASSGTKYTVTTDKPATLTCTSTSQQYMPAKFSGAAGYRHNSTGTNRIVNAISDSTNLLEVAKGGVVLKWSAGWGGDALVRAGASLELDSDKAFLDGKSRLEVEAGGKLVLKAGTMCYLKSAKIAGTELDAGDSYSVAQLRDEMGLPVAGDDLAQITVAGSSEWQGWPTEPGGRAFVPVDCTVYASDDDVEKIAACGKIYLSPGAKVVCTNLTKTLNLTAQVSGQGTFRILDADNVVLLGDNSALQSPGAFWFSNSCVTVSNRYGLGASTTARAVYHYGDRVGSLRFGGEGLTNDVALTVYPNKTAGCHIIGPESPDEDLVFNNSYRFNGGPDRNVQFRNRVHFRGGVFGTLNQDGIQDNHIYSSRSGTYAEVWFENDVKVHYYYWFASACIYHLGWAGLDWGYLFSPWSTNPQVICERDGLFGKSATGLSSLGSSSPMDLNGHQVVTPHVVSIYGGGVQVYTSDSPAMLTVTNTAASKDSSFLWVKPMFQGAAGFTYAGCGTNEFRTYFSDTTGPLTIVRNAFRLTQGAGWGGTNVTVCAKGRLIVDASSATNAFVKAGTRSQTHLSVEEGGTIELLNAGYPVKVREFTYGDVSMERGLYTRANCAAIDGPGALRVLGHPGAVIIVR